MIINMNVNDQNKTQFQDEAWLKQTLWELCKNQEKVPRARHTTAAHKNAAGVTERAETKRKLTAVTCSWLADMFKTLICLHATCMTAWITKTLCFTTTCSAHHIIVLPSTPFVFYPAVWALQLLGRWAKPSPTQRFVFCFWCPWLTHFPSVSHPVYVILMDKVYVTLVKV